MSTNLRIVLVEPREAGNVGAAARAMKNFGFRDLMLVGTLPELHPVAEWWASGAEELVQNARRVATLEEALEGAHLTVATTSARERSLTPEMDPVMVAESLAALGEQTLALVFGREDRGLTARELSLCQRTATVRTAPELLTMNLAQTVSLFCYEARKAAVPANAYVRELADAGLLERLHRRAQQLLLEIGFLHENNPDRIYHDLRAIVGRAALDSRDATILLGIIRQVELKLRRHSQSPDHDAD